MDYKTKLKDPRWQKKRLEILVRDGFACCLCKDRESTLHVHHKTYQFGKDPWDYQSRNYVTLCEECHSSEQYWKSRFKSLEQSLVTDGVSYYDLNECLSNAVFEHKFPPYGGL